MRKIFCLLLLPATLFGEELEPWKSNRHPTDVPRRHVQDIESATFQYRVMQSGTMDGVNCRSPQGVWTPFEQTWESNRSVRMENVGQSDVTNAWLSNGRNDFRTMDAIVARAITPEMTDNEKAIALWWQQTQLRFHFQGDNRELSSPVKVFNVYGHNTCGNDAICLAGLWKTAGLKVAPARLVGHCVTQVFYDGAWHLFDGDMHSVYLLRDNETIAGEQDLVRDHDLIKRTHTQGILRSQGRAGDEWESSIYVYEGKVTGDRNADRNSAMNMTLRPGESLVWQWGHTVPVKHFGSSQHRFVDRICNGLWEYRPNFSKESWRKGAKSIQGIVSGADGLHAEQGKTGVVVWAVHAPYVMVGGRLEIDGDEVPFEISWDAKDDSWQRVTNNLDAFFPPEGTARYSYYLRCRLAGDATLRRLAIVNDLQMAPLSLPEMSIGINHFTYSDETPGERRMRITHDWVERSISSPPAAPATPIRPADQGDVEGTDVVFEWQPAKDPDGDAIADYHFELSARPDMKWPLSMSFAKLISRTQDAGLARYTLKAAGELNPDCKYFWHVRAKDDRGVWGPWSPTWSFTPRGPTPPTKVDLAYDREKSVGILRWAPNSLGIRPTSYRIYASDEKGFSISDQPFTVAAGIYDVHQNAATKKPTQFPANFLVETQATEMAVIGSGVDLAGANKAFYRVVAVDARGNRSGPSDYVAAPRPMIYSQSKAAGVSDNTLVLRAQKNLEFRHNVGAIRSIGDLRTRVVDGREVMNYWDVETPRFQIDQGPTWLKIDESTGQLFGTPDSSGRSEAAISVSLLREQRTLDPDRLQWGIEKTLETRIETAGVAKQTFVIETAP